MKRKSAATVRNILLAFFLFSIAFGGICIVLFQNILRGVVYGIFAGVLYSAGAGLFSVIISKRMEIFRKALESNATVIYDGAANHWIGKEAVGGWLFALEEGLLFISHKVNINVHECRIAYRELQSVQKGKKLNSITVELKNGKKEEFVVNNRKEWIEILRTNIA